MNRTLLPATLLLALAAGPLAAQAPRTLVVGRPVTDSLTDRDPVRRTGNTPYQVWSLEGRRGQRLTIDLVSSAFDAYLILRDPDGFTFATDDDSGDELNARLHVILVRDGAYRVVVTAAGDSASGPYTLTASGWETPPAPAPGQAAAIAPGETKDGVLEPGDEIGGDGPYQDRWTFDAAAGARFRAELRSDDFDAYLSVLDPAGRVVASDDDGLGERNSLVTFRAPAAGRYTLVASSYGDELRVGAYRLTLLAETGAWAEPGTAARIEPGRTIEGRLEEGDAAGARGPEDRWTFEGRAGEVARLDAASTDFDPYLTLRVGAMVVDSNDDGGGGRNARILAVLPTTGSYTAAVSSFGGGRDGGRYALSLALLPAPPAAGRVVRIALGQHVTGRLERGDPPRPEGGMQDVWEFEGRAGQDVAIELHSSAFDTFLELSDPRGVSVAENDDGFGEGTDSFIATHLTRTGRYRIAVRGYGEDSATGLYELSVEPVSAPAPPGRAVEARVGETYAGRLEAGDTVLSDGSFADVFLLRPASSGTVVIQLGSGDFDAYLLLQDADGHALASDDDGGSGTDARLTWRLEAGRTYRILANSYGGDRATGLYRLTIRPGG